MVEIQGHGTPAGIPHAGDPNRRSARAGTESAIAQALPGVTEATRAARSRLIELAERSARMLIVGSRGRVGNDVADVLHRWAGSGGIARVVATAVPDALTAREIAAVPAGSTVVVIDVASVGPESRTAIARRAGLVIGLTDRELNSHSAADWDRARLPDLRAAAADVPILINHLLGRIDAIAGDDRSTGVSREVSARLAGVSWEALDDLERALARVRVFGESAVAAMAVGDEPEDEPALTLDALERRAIERALRRHGGVQTRAARALGVSERALRYKLAKHGLPSSRTDDHA